MAEETAPWDTPAPKEMAPWDTEEPAGAATPGGMAKDVGKSLVAGVGRGFTGLAGLPGDVASMFPDSWRDSPDKRLPTSADVQKKAESYTGEFHKPETTAGKYAQTVGEFAPGVIGGPGSLPARALRYAVAPGIATEAAGQAAQKYMPDAEPYVRAGVGLATGVNWRLKKGEYVPRSEIEDAAAEHYNHPSVKGVVIEPTAADRLRASTEQELNTHTRERLAPATYSLVKELSEPLNPAAGAQGGVTIADIESVRKLLNRQRVNYAQGSGEERLAAGKAIEKIDDFLANLKQPDLRAGNAQDAVSHLKNARAEWSTAKRMEMVDDKIASAVLRAESTYSGQNTENAIRQNLRAILEPKNKKLRAGWTDEELARVRSIVQGGHFTNFLREVGNRFGGNLGLTAALTEGLLLHRPELGAMWLGARGAKWAGNRLAQSRAEQLSNMLSERSPTGIAFRRRHPLPLPGIERPIQMGTAVGQVRGPEGFKRGGRVTRTFRVQS